MERAREDPAPRAEPRRPIAAAIAAGGLAAGVLDFVAAMVVYHASALRIGQSIAAGLLGREAARAGGWPTACWASSATS